MTRLARAGFTLLLLGGAFWLLAETLTLGGLARLAPLWVIAPTCALLAILFALEFRPGSRDAGSPDHAATAETAEPARRRTELPTLLWLGVLVAMVLVAGILVAVPLFFLLYARLNWKWRWWAALATGAAAFAALYLCFVLALGMYLPRGWLAIGY